MHLVESVTKLLLEQEHLKSVKEQPVAWRAGRRQVWAQAGMSAMLWAEATAATATRVTAENFILIDLKVLIL
jgi:hypothetical protein